MENYLKKEDTTNSKTMTYQILTRVSERAERCLRAYNRAHEYDLALFNQLKSKGNISREEFDMLEAMFYHSEKSVSEIFNEVFN